MAHPFISLKATDRSKGGRQKESLWRDVPEQNEEVHEGEHACASWGLSPAMLISLPPNLRCDGIKKPIACAVCDLTEY